MCARQVALDTETTGLDPLSGHRVIEIGAVEILNRRITDHFFHCYINPQREIEQGAMAVHGISNEFLQDKPLFAEISAEFLDFIGNDELIIHNAPFDVKFINHEFRLQDKQLQKLDKRCSILDTLPLARQKHPGQRNNLDALCKRYAVDNSQRDLHGALLDARLLAFVYLAMTGGQESLFDDALKQPATSPNKGRISASIVTDLPIIRADDKELAKHRAYLAELAQETGGTSG